MLKKKTKFIVLLLVFMLIISTFSFATDTATPTSLVPGDNARTEGEVPDGNTDTDTPQYPEEDIHNSDLYIFDNDITMDRLVDGNVFLFGKNIKVTGQVNGCLFAFGDNVTFEEGSYIMQSIYVMANKLTLHGTCVDLYACASSIDTSYGFLAQRDLRVMAANFNFKGCVGRDAFVGATNFYFDQTVDQSAIVYGNLTYSSANELSLGPDFVQGDISYKKEIVKEESAADIIVSKIISLCNSILYVLVVFLLCLWLAPKFLSQINNYMTIGNCAKAFGIGLLSIVVGIVAGFVLLFTVVGIPVGFATIVLTLLLVSIATAITSISITYKLKEKFAYSKNYMTYLTLAGVVIVIWALKLIPYVGAIISFVVNSIGVGIIVNYIFTRNHTKKDAKVETKKVEKTDKSKNRD